MKTRSMRAGGRDGGAGSVDRHEAGRRHERGEGDGVVSCGAGLAEAAGTLIPRLSDSCVVTAFLYRAQIRASANEFYFTL